MVKIVSFKGQYRITIPKDLVLSKKWKSGTRLRFVEDLDGNVYLKEVEESEKSKK
jgi:bifunctional DNA-binding transcriptional regulator/antitoxin component of YhaV-PrlF toxin-antitoxin module